MMIKNFFFFTATILNWFKVLENDSYKDVIIESFRYLVDEKRVNIFAFVKGKQWQGVNDQIKKYKIYRTTTSGMDFVPNDRMQFPENDYQLYKTVYIDVNAVPEFIDSALVSVCDYPYGVCPPYCCSLFPVRYRVQAVDKFETHSVLSDFAKTEAWNVTSPEGCAIGPDNFVLENNLEEAPKEFSLGNAFPNPFNPSTLIS